MNNPIYLDYAATTPVDPRVAEAMLGFLTQQGDFGNASSQHIYGDRARLAVEEARQQCAAIINAEASEIIFTSGATESINLGLKGAARINQRKGKHIVTMKTEHKAVLDTCQQLEKEGFTVTYLAPDKDGRLVMADFIASLRSDTTLVSVMHVNNETGVIQDIAAIAKETSARGILLHVDAAQSAGKLPIDVKATHIDLLSVSAHKIYGPKGVGFLYLRKKPRVRVEPLFHGGGHEQGMRSGTLPVHQIVAMGYAFALASKEQQSDLERMQKYQTQFLSMIKPISNLKINAELALRSPYIINLQFVGMVADALLKKMPAMACSTASACQGKGTEGSFVLRALGLTEEEAKSSIRISFGRFTSESDLKTAAESIILCFK